MVVQTVCSLHRTDLTETDALRLYYSDEKKEPNPNYNYEQADYN